MDNVSNNYDWTILAWTVWIALLAALAQKYVNTKILKEVIGKFWVPIAIYIIGLMIFFYRSSPSVNTTFFGSPESFGQFGDFIGGILNPILSFVTVILVLENLRLTRADMERKINREDADSLKADIINGKNKFNESINTLIIFPSNVTRRLNALGQIEGPSFVEDIQFIKDASMDRLTEEQTNNQQTKLAYQKISYSKSLFNLIIMQYKMLLETEPSRKESSSILSDIHSFILDVERTNLIEHAIALELIAMLQKIRDKRFHSD